MAFHTDAFGTSYPLFSIWQPSRIELQFAIWKNRPHLADEAKRRAFLERLNQIPGVEIPSAKVGALPGLSLAVLVDPQARAVFTTAFSELVAELRQASADRAGSMSREQPEA